MKRRASHHCLWCHKPIHADTTCVLEVECAVNMFRSMLEARATMQKLLDDHFHARRKRGKR